MLFNQEIDFAIIEGFKQRTFSKIVIGELPVDNCILKNPSINEVLTSLSLFEDFTNKK
jgi:molybdopterin-guanine dinucleotide biosynthesis protein